MDFAMNLQCFKQTREFFLVSYRLWLDHFLGDGSRQLLGRWRIYVTQGRGEAEESRLACTWDLDQARLISVFIDL
jgi:hypothetical protein